MAGLFDKQTDMYVDIRPTYPSYLFSMLAALTPHHSLPTSLSLSLILLYIIRSLINLSQFQLSKKKKTNSNVGAYPAFFKYLIIPSDVRIVSPSSHTHRHHKDNYKK